MALALAAGGRTQAAVSTKVGVAPLLSPTAADDFYGSATTHTNGVGASGRPVEVVELARALKGDPDLIYEYVRNTSRTVWSYGLSKGAMGVIVDRSGTAFDQAHLMVELLRQSGISATLKVGTITLTGAQFQDWSGLTSATAACQLLSSGGIPATINGSTFADCGYGSATVATLEIGHAWVSATLDGVSYEFDPAYKPYDRKTGLDLGAALAMTPGATVALNATESTTVDGIPKLLTFDRPGLETALQGWTANLRGTIDANLPAGDVADAVGGRTITPYAIPTGGLRQASLPYAALASHVFAGDLPDAYRTKLRLRIAKARPDGTTPVIIDKTVFADEIYGRRLTFEPNFDTAGASFTGALRLTDDLGTASTLASAAYPDNPTFSRGTVSFTLDLPYAANAGAYMDADLTKPVTFALPFTIVLGLGDAGRGLIDKWGQRLDTPMPVPPDPSCLVCYSTLRSWKGDGRRETLAAIWLADAARALRLNADIGHGLAVLHYALGVVAADTTTYQTADGAYWITDSFDRLDVETGLSLTSVSANATDRRAAVLAAASAITALKANVSAQVSDLPDISSTATRFRWGNDQVKAFYQYANSTQAGDALGLSRTDGQLSTTGDGVLSGADTSIGAAEVAARRQALSDAVTDYVAAGFTVTTSEEAFLGPGQRAGGLYPAGGNYLHMPTSQRGGAIFAVRSDANGDPLEVAATIVNPNGVLDGGGGGAQLYHQEQYDPATAADVVKGRFVDRAPGAVDLASPASLSVGSGEFPYRLTPQLLWRGASGVQDQTHGPIAHREPQGGWTTNFANTLTFSGSALEAMGASDVRAGAASIVAFAALQDTFRALPSLKRDVAAQLVTAWWTDQLVHNVATVNVGAATRQFVLLTDGTWTAPGPAVAHLSGSAAASPVSVLPPTSACGTLLGYVHTRGLQNQSTFTVTGAHGDVQTFSPWLDDTRDAATGLCSEQHGYHLTRWEWLKGVTLSLNYAQPALGSDQVEILNWASNNISTTRIAFGGGGLQGFSTYVYDPDSESGGWPTTWPVSVGAAGGLVTHTDPMGGVTRFHQTSLGAGPFTRQLIDQVFAADDASVPSRRYVYDGLGQLSQRYDKLAVLGSRAPTQFFWGNRERSEVVDALGYSRITYLDERGAPVRETDPTGAITTRTYDGRGRLTSRTSPDGDQTTYDYSARNLAVRATAVASPGSAEAGQSLVTQTAWSATLDLPSAITNPKGGVSTFDYVGGELSQTTYPRATPDATPETSNLYFYPGGLVMSAVTPAGRTTTATYAGVFWDTLTDTSAGSASTSLRSDAGDPQSVSDVQTGTHRFAYDPLRRVVMVQDQANAPTARRLTYDSVGRVTKVERGPYVGSTNPFNPANLQPQLTLTAEYDAVGNKIRETSPSAVVQTSYDALNRPVCRAVRMNPQVYDALPSDACQPSLQGTFGPDRITRTSYDPAGRVVQTETGVGTPLQQVSSSSVYSPGGKLKLLSDANGNTTGFEYDGFGRLKRIRYPAAPRGSGQVSATDFEEYSYDANGNRTAWRRRDGVTETYDYDGMDRMIAKHLGGTGADDVFYTHLNHGMREEGRLGSATASAYWVMEFDPAGKLLTDFGPDPMEAGGVAGFSGTYSYSELAQISGFGEAYGFNYVLGRLTGQTGIGATALVSLTYDAVGRRSGLTRSNGLSTTYSYDLQDRLVGLSHSSPGSHGQAFEETYAYNPAGQLVSRTQGGSAYVWGGQPTTTANFTHDQLNRDAAIAAAYGYDSAGNLTSDGTRAFTYDLESRLRSVASTTSNVGLAYDPWGRLDQITANGVTTTLRYFGAQLMGELDLSQASGSQLLRSYGPGLGTDEHFVWREKIGGAWQTRWLHQDRLGSVVGVSDSSGAVTPYTYGPYGEPQSWSGSRFRYTGQMAIPEAQLYHYRARAYDPMMGRFLQTDPIRYGDGPNIYAYVHGDPVNGTDPTGEFDFLKWLQGFFSGGDSANALSDGASSGGTTENPNDSYRCADCIPTQIETPSRPATPAAPPPLATDLGVPTRPSSPPGIGLGGAPSSTPNTPPPCSPPGPNFTCDANGKLVPTQQYQRQICENYNALSAANSRVGALTVPQSTVGVANVLSGGSLPEVAGAASRFAGPGFTFFGGITGVVTGLLGLAPPPPNCT